MTLKLDLSPQMERCLMDHAARRGIPITEYVLDVLEREVAPKPLTARELLAMSPEERAPFLAAAAKDAAPLYEADLALPPEQRELTALTALDGGEFYDSEA